MAQLNYCFLYAIEVVLNVSSVSGRKGNYAPKAWALVDFNGQESEGSIKVRTTKRTAKAVKALGNESVVKVLLKVETANEKRTFGENGDKTEYFETVTRYTIVKVLEVLEEGTMPKAKTESAEIDASDEIAN